MIITYNYYSSSLFKTCEKASNPGIETLSQLSVLESWGYCYPEPLYLEAEIVFSYYAYIELKSGSFGNVIVENQGYQREQSSVLIKAGSAGIGTTTPSELLSVNGNVSIESSGNCRDTGGAAACNNFVDFAELFPSIEPVESGDIVVISFEEPASAALASSNTTQNTLQNPPHKPEPKKHNENPKTAHKSMQYPVHNQL